VQVDPIKPTLKPSGTKRLKLKHDELLSNLAFEFKLRRYSLETMHNFENVPVGRCRFSLSNPR
jgi:hypothetical protein